MHPSSVIAGGSLREQIVQGARDDIEHCKDGQQLLRQQGDAYQKEIEEWVAYYQQQHQALGEKNRLLKEAWKERLSRAKKAYSALGSLMKDEKGKVHLPHFGWQSAESMGELVQDLEQEYQKIQQEVDR